MAPRTCVITGKNASAMLIHSTKIHQNGTWLVPAGSEETDLRLRKPPVLSSVALATPKQHSRLSKFLSTGSQGCHHTHTHTHKCDSK